jgi:glutathionylspermidine synthase
VTTLIDHPITRSTMATLPLRAGVAIAESKFQSIRRRMCLEFCKWDPQVGDVSTLARFPLIVSQATWQELAYAAEALAAETLELERRLTDRPELFAELGLGRRLRHLLGAGSVHTPAAARVMRFDFHSTPGGWRVSEVNSDVPGGFAESSAFPRLIAAHVDDAGPAGDPAAAYVDAILQTTHRDNGTIALLCAPGFMEDQQVVHHLARLLKQRGVSAQVAQPRNLLWRGGRAYLNSKRLSAIVRFYQGEWLPRLPRHTGWHHLFAGGLTPVANPGVAVLAESKRLPLLWNRLGVKLSAWPRYLPETRDPRDVPWRRDDDWLIKAAYSNTGDAIFARDVTPQRQWLATSLDVLLHHHAWVAQRRFETLPMDTPDGPRYPCIGVYVINGVACGAYGRIAASPIIRFDATDVALLVEWEGTP